MMTKMALYLLLSLHIMQNLDKFENNFEYSYFKLHFESHSKLEY